MKTAIFALFFLTTSPVIAQQNGSKTPALAAPFVLNGKIIDDASIFKLILPDDIENINILKGVNASALYGSRAANGAIVITLKPNVKLLSFDKLLKKFSVKKSDRQYVAYIDNRPIQNTNEFYASLTWIKEIKLQKRNNGMADIPYLNIISNK